MHPGLTGFANLKAETFNMPAASRNKIAGECYFVMLAAVINEFGPEKADSKIRSKLKLAKMLPFTDGPEQAEALRQELLR